MRQGSRALIAAIAVAAAFAVPASASALSLKVTGKGDLDLKTSGSSVTAAIRISNGILQGPASMRPACISGLPLRRCATRRKIVGGFEYTVRKPVRFLLDSDSHWLRLVGARNFTTLSTGTGTARLEGSGFYKINRQPRQRYDDVIVEIVF